MLIFVFKQKTAYERRSSDWSSDVCSSDLWGYRPFPEEQINALIPLMHGIVRRHRITRGNIVAHSDIAPARKQDPGELFPWNTLARFRLALPRPTKNLMDPHWSDGGFQIGRASCMERECTYV